MRTLRRLGFLLLVAAALGACTGGAGTPNRTTDTRSSQFATDAEKLAFLARYLTMASPVEAAEYHIQYHDNSGGMVPGPSSWDIQVVMRVPAADLGKWTAGMSAASAPAPDLAWGYQLLPQDARWTVSSQPRVYTRADSQVVVAVFEREGIVFKRVWAE